MRPSMQELILEVAKLMAKRSTCSARARVGAVLADTAGRIVATGYNGSPRGWAHCDEVGCDLDKDGHCTRAIHAEENCILQCAIYGISTDGLILYSTHNPCQRCTVRLYQAGIRKVVFLNQYQEITRPMGMEIVGPLIDHETNGKDNP